MLDLRLMKTLRFVVLLALVVLSRAQSPADSSDSEDSDNSDGGSGGNTGMIVVGAGPSGSIFTRRLHDLSPHTDITLITDGPEYPVEAAYSETWRWNNNAAAHWVNNIPLNLHIKTVEQAQVGFRDQYIPHCNEAGGCQLFNGQVCQREEKVWWDAYAAAVGDPFFNWDSMLANTRWIEDWKAPDPYGIHGQGGPIAYHALSPGEPFASTVMEAISSLLGIPIVNDTNGPLGPAVGLTVENIDVLPNGSPVRQVAYIKAVRPVIGRKVHVIVNATVFKIIFHPVHRARAVGVKYFQNGKVHTLRSTDGVALAAGAIGTPKLAQLSGLGDCNYLVSVGVLDTVADCVLSQPAIGQNLKTQYAMGSRSCFPTDPRRPTTAPASWRASGRRPPSPTTTRSSTPCSPWARSSMPACPSAASWCSRTACMGRTARS